MLNVIAKFIGKNKILNDNSFTNTDLNIQSVSDACEFIIKWSDCKTDLSRKISKTEFPIPSAIHTLYSKIGIVWLNNNHSLKAFRGFANWPDEPWPDVELPFAHDVFLSPKELKVRENGLVEVIRENQNCHSFSFSPLDPETVWICGEFWGDPLLDDCKDEDFEMRKTHYNWDDVVIYTLLNNFRALCHASMTYVAYGRIKVLPERYLVSDDRKGNVIWQKPPFGSFNLSDFSRGELPSLSKKK